MRFHTRKWVKPEDLYANGKPTSHGKTTIEFVKDRLAKEGNQ